MSTPSASPTASTKLTPRLCIDTRSVDEFPIQALINQEVLDQLVSQAENPLETSEWIREKKTVLIAHPRQSTPEGFRRYETGKRLHRIPFYGFWEKKFLRETGATLFHRFRPIDQASPTHDCTTITTLLPARGSLPFFLSRKRQHSWVVPCEGDKKLLQKQYLLAPEQIHTVRPSPRSFVHSSPVPPPAIEGGILFLVRSGYPKPELKRLKEILKSRFGPLPHKIITLEKSADITREPWVRLLSQTKLAVYLEDRPFDWATLALECQYWNIPTLFLDQNKTLVELLPDSPFLMSRFLLELRELDSLKKLAQQTRSELEKQGLFDKTAQSRHYATLYRVS